MDMANFKFDHPLGTIYGLISDIGLKALRLPHTDQRTHPYLVHSAPNIVRGRFLKRALQEYFAGIRDPFGAIDLDLAEATPFQKSVWAAAQKIPWGETCSYAELARRMNTSPGAARAVGHALALNPIPILIPCHRILPAQGGLGGFAAGVGWKRELLQLEGYLL